MEGEIGIEGMDRMLEALGKAENGRKLSACGAIGLYYPRMKALADEKGLRIADVYRVFCETNPDSGVSEQSFRTYWHKAARKHRAQAEKPAQDAGVSGTAAGNGEPAETVRPVAQIEKSAPAAEKPAEIASPAVTPEKPAMRAAEIRARMNAQNAGKPEANPAKGSGFRTDEDIRAQGVELMRKYGIDPAELNCQARRD